MNGVFRLDISRDPKLSMTQQIYRGIRKGIASGTIAPNTRLSSWQDLSSQLGVSRGTVKRAYELLRDDQLIVTRGAGGTWVVEELPAHLPAVRSGKVKITGLFYDFYQPPLDFQVGVPALDTFPQKLWMTCWRQALLTESAIPPIYPDPRGLIGLRQEIAGYLALARGVICSPDQVLITAGFSAALGLVLDVLKLSGSKAIIEEPGYPRTRDALRLHSVETVPVAVDGSGMVCPCEEFKDTDVKLAIVTPSQQAPLGMPMSFDRRTSLLDWAAANKTWIIEDDYAGELQLTGPASPALASQSGSDRVFHIGSFSKTLTPALRMGFLVVPEPLVGAFGEYAGHLAPAGSNIAQRALLNFMSGGFYLRHLRKTRKVYRDRKFALVNELQKRFPDSQCEHEGSLYVRLVLPDSVNDAMVAEMALDQRLGVVPLSKWYCGPVRTGGLLLGITNVNVNTVGSRCESLAAVISSQRSSTQV